MSTTPTQSVRRAIEEVGELRDDDDYTDMPALGESRGSRPTPTPAETQSAFAEAAATVGEILENSHIVSWVAKVSPQEEEMKD